MSSTSSRAGSSLQQAVNSTAELTRHTMQMIDVCFRDVIQFTRDGDLRFYLHQRAVGDVQESSEFLIRAPAVAFGDTRRNRYSGTSDLAGKPEFLFIWPGLGELVDPLNQLDGLLPGDQVAISAH